MDRVLLAAVFNEEQHFGHVAPLLAAHFVLRGGSPVPGGAGPLLGCWRLREDSPAGAEKPERTRERSSQEPARRATGSSNGDYRKGRGEGGVTAKVARASSSQVLKGSSSCPIVRLAPRLRR